MFFQGAQQRRVGLAQRQRQVVQWYQQRRTGLGEAHRTAEEGLVVFHAGSVRQVVFQPDLVRRTFQVGDPARVEDPGSQDVLDHVAPYQGCLVAAVPDQPDLPAGRLDAAGAHVADQLLVGRDAAHGLAQGGAVHRDVAEHAPGAGLDEARRMQAEQGIAGMLAEIAEQALVGFARQALAIVVELVGLEAGGGQGRGDVQAEPFGVAQVLQQGRNRGGAKGLHGRCSCRGGWNRPSGVRAGCLDRSQGVSRSDSDRRGRLASIGSQKGSDKQVAATSEGRGSCVVGMAGAKKAPWSNCRTAPVGSWRNWSGRAHACRTPAWRRRWRRSRRRAWRPIRATASTPVSVCCMPAGRACRTGWRCARATSASTRTPWPIRKPPSRSASCWPWPTPATCN